MKVQLDMVLNGKGGVGKSFFATHFVQYLKDRSIQHIAVDTDNENSTLKRFHRDALFINLARPQAIDALFVELEKTGLLVVDCRAASTDLFLDYFEELDIFDILKDMGALLTIISPVNHEADSVKQIKVVSERLNDACRYIVVKNQTHGEQFTIYDRSKTRIRVTEELGGKEITMPKLYDWLVTALNQADIPITPALQSTSFSLLDRQRLKNWQRLFYKQLDSVQELLIPDGQEPIAGSHRGG